MQSRVEGYCMLWLCGYYGGCGVDDGVEIALVFAGCIGYIGKMLYLCRLLQGTGLVAG